MTNLIKNQQEFIKWLKERKLYSEMESSHTMARMFSVWFAMKKKG